LLQTLSARAESVGQPATVPHAFYRLATLVAGVKAATALGSTEDANTLRGIYLDDVNALAQAGVLRDGTYQMLWDGTVMLARHGTYSPAHFTTPPPLIPFGSNRKSLTPDAFSEYVNGAWSTQVYSELHQIATALGSIPATAHKNAAMRSDIASARRYIAQVETMLAQVC